eukprot:410078-Pelagomonas_calceolata.AAC.5
MAKYKGGCKLQAASLMKALASAGYYKVMGTEGFGKRRLFEIMDGLDAEHYKVMGAEGFGKRRLFEIMDDLEARTRPIMVAAR